MGAVYERPYVCEGVNTRLAILERRYRMYCNGINEQGEELTGGSGAVMRSKTKQEYYTLILIDELLGYIQQDFTLSEDASIGFERLCEPMERHRQYRRGV